MKTFRVLEITKIIKSLIENGFPDLVEVEGEVSNLSRAGSGHIYFTLKDSGAQLKAAFFKNYNIGRDSFVPKNGDKVKAVGNIALYEPDGSYQLIVKKISYDSEGDFWKKFEEVKKKLEAEGLFDEARKKVVPRYPRRVALLTSESGAAIKDFIVTCEREGARFDIELWSIPVQGLDAAPKICAALRRISKTLARYDVVILMRGGGSLEDLAVFNSEEIAREIARLSVPVISAIGHERDFTIADFVSDLRLATPTAAAVYLSAGYLELENKLEVLSEKVLIYMIKYIQNNYQRLDFNEFKLKSFSPLAKLDNSKRKVTIAAKDLLNIMKSRISGYKNILANYESRLTLLNPDNVLERGYAIIYKDKQVLTSVSKVFLEENIEIKMKDGYIYGSVKGINSEVDNGENSNNS